MESMSIPGPGPSKMARRDPSDNHLVVESCTILTTKASPLIQSIHHRMPVILALKEIDLWLDPQKNLAKLKAIPGPIGPAVLTCRRVSDFVNNPRNEGRRCVEALSSAVLIYLPSPFFCERSPSQFREVGL